MKNLKQTAKKWTVLSIVLSLLLAAGLVSCANSDEEEENVAKTVTVTLVLGEGETGTSGTYSIEKGKTIAAISGYASPAKTGYTFSGWYDSTGKSYTTSTKITSDVKLYARWASVPKTVTNEDGTTTTTTETKAADGSTTTTAVTKDAEGKTTETKTTSIKPDGTKITETKTSEKTVTETVNADNSSSTTTKKTDESGTTTTETENKDSSGNTTGSIVVTESTSSDGTATTTTVEKDASGKVTQTTTVTETVDGNVTTTVTDADGKTTTTESKKGYKKYIDAGIKALEKETPDFDSAVENFKEAYKAEANDETRVYSALASLASISTKKATADFVKNHLGITNYPSTMNALFSPDWLQAAEYIDYEDEERVSGRTFEESNPNEVTVSLGTCTINLWGRPSFTKMTSSSYYAYYRCSVKPVDNYESGAVVNSGIYKLETVENETAYFRLDDLKNYEERTNGSSNIKDYYNVTLDENGEYYVDSSYLIGVDTSSATAYTYDDNDNVEVFYSFEVTSTGYEGYYRCSITPADYNDNTVNKWHVYKQITVNGKTIYGQLSDIAEYEKDTTGSTQYGSEYYTYTLDDNGEYYVYFYVDSNDKDKFSSYKMYKSTGWDKAEYTCTVKVKFAKLNKPSWLPGSLNNDLFVLILANILEGNTKGLNSALDDFYSLIFDSSEYKDAISKLDEITTSVKVPANVIEDLGLTDIVGNTSVKLGPAEIGLVKTAFTALKATVEYFQSYNLNSDLSFLKFDWNDAEAAQKVFEKYLRYDASVDPLKNGGFLSQRSAEKMESSKANFAQAVSDLIASYDDILANSGDYPTVVSDTLNEYKILKDGAEKLQAAIRDGGKFYIPNVETEDELKTLSSWPTSGDKYVDFDKLFNWKTFYLYDYVSKDDGGIPSVRSMNSSELYDETTGEHYIKYNWATQYKYYSKTSNKYKTIEFSDRKLSATDSNTNKKVVNLLLDAYKDADYLDDDEIGEGTLGIQINLKFDQIFGGFDITDYVTSIAGYRIEASSSGGSHYIKVPLGIVPGLYVYNFYHDGEIADDLKALVNEEYGSD